MDYLPPELLTKIFSFLDPVSIINCRQVCRRWRAVSIKMVNPLYIPEVISAVMEQIKLMGKLRNILKLRLVCKLWKDGLDRLTLHEHLLLNGITTIDSHHTADSLQHSWNPFPSRIVKLKLCYGHDDPDNIDHQLGNIEEDLIIERFGVHIRFLQVQIQHADCAEKHLVKILNCLLKSLRGLVLGESLSPHRFVKSKVKNCDNNEETSLVSVEYNELGHLESLQFLKLDDIDCKLQYSKLYKRIIENAPNLQHLEINGYQHLDMEIVRLLACRVSSKMSLTHLKMDAESSNTLETLEILSKCDFPLKYFSLKINSFGNAGECAKCTSLLHSSLQNFGSTLERLELKLNWFEEADNAKPDLLYTFPSSRGLTKLKKLKLVGYRGQLDFLTDLNMLQSLMIVDYNPQSQNIFNSDTSFQTLLPKLEEIFLPLQGTLYSSDPTFKNKLQNFMYDGDSTFLPKYCGLYQEIFP